MSKKLPVDDFKWIDDISIFTEGFIKNYDEESDIGYLFVVDVEYPKNLHMLHKLMNNSVFGKTMENIRNHIKLVTTDKRRSVLASEPNYHSAKYISKDL